MSKFSEIHKLVESLNTNSIDTELTKSLDDIVSKEFDSVSELIKDEFITACRSKLYDILVKVISNSNLTDKSDKQEVLSAIRDLNGFSSSVINEFNTLSDEVLNKLINKVSINISTFINNKYLRGL